MLNYLNKTFYMVRHGETVANKKNVAAGIFDTPLTEQGKLQAVLLESTIREADFRLDYMVHSGLSRSIDTAKILNQRINLPLLENKKIAEQNFGDWQGMNWDKMRGLIKAGQHPPNGETITDFYMRAIAGIHESICAHQGAPLLVTHGGVFDAFFENYELNKIDVKNCILYKCLFKKGGSGIIAFAKEYDLASE